MEENCWHHGIIGINDVCVRVRVRVQALARLISASISRWMTFDPAQLPILPGGNCCALALLNTIPKFPKEKHCFVRSIIKIQQIYVFNVYD